MSILHMSISAGILVIAIVIIRIIALNKLPKTMFLILWGIALCRLLVPISIPSRFSIYSILGEISKQMTSDTPASPVIETILPSDSTARMVGQTVLPMQEQAFSVAPMTIIWFACALAVFIFFVFVYVKNYRELRLALPVRDNEFLDEWIAEHKLLRTITIMQSDRISTPVAVGLVNPRIILPKSMNMDNKQLFRYVLTHEYYHIRRLDTFWKMLFAVALCIHWFNPMVWVMVMLFNRDLELACDEMVIQHFGAETKTEYAYSLIGMAEQRSKFVPLYNGFSKNAIEERITAIMKINKISLLGIILAFVLVAGTVAVFATSATQKENENIPQNIIQERGIAGELSTDVVSALLDRYRAEGDFMELCSTELNENTVRAVMEQITAPDWQYFIGEENPDEFGVSVNENEYIVLLSGGEAEETENGTIIDATHEAYAIVTKDAKTQKYVISKLVKLDRFPSESAQSSSTTETLTTASTPEPSTALPSLSDETASTGDTSVSITSDYRLNENAYSNHTEISFTDEETVGAIKKYFQNLKESSIEMPSRPEIGSYLFTVSISNDEGTTTYRFSAPQKDGILYCKDLSTSEWSSMTGWIQVSEAGAYDYIKNLFS